MGVFVAGNERSLRPYIINLEKLWSSAFQSVEKGGDSVPQAERMDGHKGVQAPFHRWDAVYLLRVWLGRRMVDSGVSPKRQGTLGSFYHLQLIHLFYALRRSWQAVSAVLLARKACSSTLRC